MGSKLNNGRRFLVTAAIFFVVVAACCVMGCRPTDVLTEIVYDQSSEDVDYENINKFIVNDSSSDIENPTISSQEISDDAPANEEEQNLVVYSSDPNTLGFHTKPSVFSMTPEFKGFEASVGITYELTTDEDALKYEVNKDDLENDAKRSLEMVHEDSGEVGSGDEGDTGEAGSQGEGNSDEAGDASSGNGPGKGTDAEGGSSSGEKIEVKYKDTRSKRAKPPHVDHIAAAGQLAVIVQAIGGKDALVAADKELLNSSFTKVFSDEGAKNIVQGWSDDGSSAGKNNTNVQKIIDSGAQAILCYDSNYYDGLTNSQREKLNDAGITFVYVNALTRTDYLKKTVNTVGEMLSQSTIVGEAGNTVSNASYYADWHDDLVDEVLDANGGELASADGKTYESGSSGYSYNSDAPYTLLMDGYDSKARFTKSTGSFNLNSSDGVLLSTLGYKSRTTSYYMQVGGVINNAATRFRASADGKKMVVWQFPFHLLKFDKGNWSNRSSVLNNSYFPSSGKAWEFSLLTTSLNTAEGGEYSSMSGGTPGSSFGTDTFPTVITTTQEAKDAFVSSVNRKNGLYSPYDVTTVGGFSYFGFSTGNALVYSCIGVDGKDANGINQLLGGMNNKEADEHVKVNPHGLFTSWTEGDSMESVLECAWTNDVVNDESSSIGWENEVKEFYKEIYRYDLTSSDMSTINDGKGLE